MISIYKNLNIDTGGLLIRDGSPSSVIIGEVTASMSTESLIKISVLVALALASMLILGEIYN